MKKLTYLLIAITIGFYSCSEEDPKKDPTIDFITTPGYTYENTSLQAGDSIAVGIEAEYNGDDKLALFEVKVNNQVVYSEDVDNFELERAFTLTKSELSNEEWTFEITDAGGRSANVYIVLTLAFGDIITNNSLILGAQDNASIGSFYSTQNNTTYFQDGAFDNQSKVDILYFYDTSDESVISCPNANITDVFTGTTGLSNWTTLNETRYYKTNITTSQFDAVSNDSLINMAYNANDAKRKAKNLAIDDIYSFRTEDGRNGLFKVVAINGDASGSIEIAIKVQE